MTENKAQKAPAPLCDKITMTAPGLLSFMPRAMAGRLTSVRGRHRDGRERRRVERVRQPQARQCDLTVGPPVQPDLRVRPAGEGRCGQTGGDPQDFRRVGVVALQVVPVRVLAARTANRDAPVRAIGTQCGRRKEYCPGSPNPQC